MRKRALFRLVLIGLLLIWLGGPFLNGIDPWDAFPDTGDNFILLLTVGSVCIGLMLDLAMLAIRLLRPATRHAVLMISEMVPRRRVGRNLSLFAPDLPQPLRI